MSRTSRKNRNDGPLIHAAQGAAHSGVAELDLRADLRSLDEGIRRKAPPFETLWAAAAQTAGSQARKRGRLATLLLGPHAAPGQGARPRAASGAALMRRAAFAGTIAALAGVTILIMRRQVLPNDQDALVMARSLSSWNAPSDAWMSTRVQTIPSGVPAFTIESISLPNQESNLTGAQALQTEEVLQ